MVKTVLIFVAVLLWMTAEESAALRIKTAYLDVNLEELGSYNGRDDAGKRYKKTYYISRNFKSNWEDAKAICKAIDLELATFDTLHEANNFFKLPNKDIPDYVYVDGKTTVPGSRTEWFWTNSGQRKIAYAIPWAQGEPNNAGLEPCMTVIKEKNSKKIGFNDLTCWSTPSYFICQKPEYS